VRPEDYGRARELFHELGELPAEARREALDRSGVSADVRAEVESLLAIFDEGRPLAEDEAGGIGQFLVENVAGADDGEGGRGHPDRIGSYTIVERLGEGGMGIVYRGQQEHPRREVAIKVLRGLAGETELRRFEYEAEILGRLDHPFVAKVIEAGVEPALNGLPFIVMELVSGEDLLTYTESRIPGGAAGRAELLALFADVCEGVEHAHQHGVVHRDLKPSNVLVSEEGRPRILDFGIARPADVGDEDASTPGRTMTGSVIGTLAWMSPEQARGDRDAMDVRSDVYSLGVLLYRLLTGEMPYDVSDLPPWEAARKVCEDEPRRLGRIDGSLCGDLEAIAAMALEKEPGKRYAGAGALGRDVRRFLELQPVEARPWSTTYQLTKFARRHWLLVSTATALLISLVAGLITGLVLWRQAEGFALDAQNEAARAEENATEARTQSDIATAKAAEADRERRLAEEARVAEVARAAELERVVAYQGELIATLDSIEMGSGIRNDMLADVRGGLDRSGVSKTKRVAELARYEELLDRVDLEAVASEAIKRSLLEPARAAIGRQFSDLPLIRARLLRRLAEMHVMFGFHLGAIECFREALAISEPELGPLHEDVLELRVDLALQLTQIRSPAEALASFEELHDVVLENLGMAHPSTSALLRGLASVYTNTGRADEAREAYEQAIEAGLAANPDNTGNVADLRRALARSLFMSGRVGEAEEILAELVEDQREAIEAGDQFALRILTDYGIVFLLKEDYVEAEAILGEAAERLRKSVGGKHVVTLETLDQLALTLQRQGRFEEAALVWRETIDARRQTWPQGGAYLSKSLADLALTLEDLGELEEGIALAREAVERSTEVFPDGHRIRDIAERALARLEAALEE
jgi:serine/threonine protein kinase/tetratricopeptide (TPR) repeat protein